MAFDDKTRQKYRTYLQLKGINAIDDKELDEFIRKERRSLAIFVPMALVLLGYGLYVIWSRLL
jgi:hypothetical protein